MSEAIPGTVTVRIPPRLIQASCVYVGLAATIPQYMVFEYGPVTIGLLMAGGLAIFGWRGLSTQREVGRYLLFALLVASWTVVSAIATWDTSTARLAVIQAAWLVVLVPGLAGLMRRNEYRHAFLGAWAFGASVYTVTATFRLLTRGTMFDVEGDATTRHLLGQVRGAVNLVVLVVLPYLLVGDGGRLLRLARWPLVVTMGLWMVQSGGRAGLLALGLVLLVVALARPGNSRRARMLLITVLVGVVGFSVMQATGGQATEATNRLMSFIRGERTDSDDARELLLRKAWNLALDSPAFGVGMGHFETTYHPVIEDAQSRRSREIADTYEEHNTFAAAMAETGFPGLFAFVGLCVALLIAAARFARSLAGRAAVASLSVLYFTVFFHNANGPRLFLPMALALAPALTGLVATHRVGEHDERHASALA